MLIKRETESSKMDDGVWVWWVSGSWCEGERVVCLVRSELVAVTWTLSPARLALGHSGWLWLRGGRARRHCVSSSSAAFPRHRLRFARPRAYAYMLLRITSRASLL